MSAMLDSGGSGGGTLDADDDPWGDDGGSTDTSTDTTVSDSDLDSDDGHDLNLGTGTGGSGGYTGDPDADADVIEDPSDGSSIIVTGDAEERQETRDEEVFPAISDHQRAEQEQDDSDNSTETSSDTDGGLGQIVEWLRNNPKKAGAGVLLVGAASMGGE